ncbi:carboxypeptidase-like regulatory domain-containing protein [Hymenobacter taeanensis]|uniref:Carboxypeptidase-like regulatory domain-containing protein n=1 Tax=Hymenobacter taeanensis TaxID=2735321 RepID=A0A6M6BHX9_9BACT|nr:MULTISPECIES: carboxypeptidase-like regulatory domain-containing protein [Hymenobacter]QJX46893.1 carboxypeptidase-like regulatory domain-containing protein [Hymenobacter taeanensis]UOQ80766.1 carboxypeptidase-like regulatory domain-containing protein [Hymenobacter sp. 5414T-23]
MPTRSTLSIPKPCHENWQTMTPAAQGRHCAACDKVVVDFTRMTDAEIVAFLGQSAGKSCGRFRADQLNRTLGIVAPASDTMWRGRWMALVALIGLGAAAAPIAVAQQAPPVRIQRSITLGMVAQPAFSTPTLSLPPLMVRGRILDHSSATALPGVTVLLKGTTVGTSTNSDGTFELLLPAGQLGPILLSIHSVGFVTKEVIANPEEPLHLSLDADVKGEFESWYSPRSLWYRLTRPFRQL